MVNAVLPGTLSHVNRSAMALNDRFRDREAQSAALRAGRSRRVGLVKAIEYVRQVLGRDAFP
jgi:hypothetical protein